MSELVHPDLDPEYTLKLADGPNPAVSVLPSKKKYLTENQWTVAFTEYMAVYLDEFPTATQDLFSYFHMIQSKMGDGEDWRTYDYAFRKSRDTHKFRWSEILPKQRLKAGMKPVHSSFNAQKQQQHQLKRPFRDQGGRGSLRSPTIQTGYCFAFHGRYSRCNERTCQYKHTC